MHALAKLVPPAFLLSLLVVVGYLGYRIGRDAAAPVPSTDVYTCSMHPQVRQNGPGQCPICHMELVLLRPSIDPVVVQNMGVRVAIVDRGRVVQTVRAFGVVRAAESRQHDVALKIDGYVERLHADREGIAIAVGTPLFDVYSADLLVAQDELLAARRAGDEGLLAAARRKLSLWDIDDAQIAAIERDRAARRTLTWTSPVDGILVQKNVVAGAAVAAGQALLRVVDLRVVWLEAQVPESMVAHVAVGQPATAWLAALPGMPVRGSVVFVAPMLDASTRTTTVRIEVANDDLRLKPGMFARVELASVVAEDAVRAPREAIIDTGRRQVAYVTAGTAKFAMRDVVVGAAGDGGVVEVRRGLAPGDVVVTSGQLLIDADSRVDAAQARHTDDGLLRDGEPSPVRLDVSAASRAGLATVVDRYLALTAALSADRSEPALWQSLATAIDELRGAAEPELAAHAVAIALALPTPTESIAMQRQKLAIASERVIEMVTAAPPRARAFADLLVLRCPMFSGRWLQTSEPVRNPYYGASMLECGSVERRLLLEKGN